MGLDIGTIIMASSRWTLNYALHYKDMYQIKIESIEAQAYVLKHKKKYCYHFLISTLLLNYYDGVFLDVTTKAAKWTLLSIIATFIIDRSAHLIPRIWSWCNNYSFKINNGYELLYQYRGVGKLIVFAVIRLLVVLLFIFFHLLIKLNIKQAYQCSFYITVTVD
jgi:hypothetical protein